MTLDWYQKLFAVDAVLRSARNSLVVALPCTLLIIGSRLAGFDSNLEEAAMDLGADYTTTRRSVVLPLILPAMVSA